MTLTNKRVNDDGSNQNLVLFIIQELQFRRRTVQTEVKGCLSGSRVRGVQRQDNTAFLRKDKLIVNRKIYELEYLKKSFRMGSEVQIRNSTTRVEDKEMSQRPSPTQNREIPEQEGEAAEEGGGRQIKAEIRHIKNMGHQCS
jgi:hypothetical protein